MTRATRFGCMIMGVTVGVITMTVATARAADARATSPREAYEAKRYTDAGGKALPYRLLKPANYDPQKKYPLVVFFHGAGERGTDNAKQLTHCADAFLRPQNREKYPCFVIFPQCPEDQKWVDMPWDTASGKQPEKPTDGMRMTIELIAQMCKEYSIDQQRLYVSGLSMGGFATWDAITRYPKMFAAAVPICGGGDEAKVGPAAKIPVWAFHSADDGVVKVVRTRNMVKAMRNAGGEPKYTEYNGLGHFSWGKAYAEPQLFPWMFSQKRTEK